MMLDEILKIEYVNVSHQELIKILNELNALPLDDDTDLSNRIYYFLRLNLTTLTGDELIDYLGNLKNPVLIKIITSNITFLKLLELKLGLEKFGILLSGKILGPNKYNQYDLSQFKESDKRRSSKTSPPYSTMNWNLLQAYNYLYFNRGYLTDSEKFSTQYAAPFKSTMLVLDESQAFQVNFYFPYNNGLLKLSDISHRLICLVASSMNPKSSPQPGSKTFCGKLLFSLFEKYILELASKEELMELSKIHILTTNDTIAHLRKVQNKPDYSFSVDMLYDKLKEVLKDLDPWKCLEEFHDVSIINDYKQQVNETDPNRMREIAQNAYIYMIFYYLDLHSKARSELTNTLNNDAVPEFSLDLQLAFSSVTNFFWRDNAPKSETTKSSTTTPKMKQD